MLNTVNYCLLSQVVGPHSHWIPPTRLKQSIGVAEWDDNITEHNFEKKENISKSKTRSIKTNEYGI